MSDSYLDKDGLTYLWGKIKDHVLQNGIFYGTCSTAAATVAKTATVNGVTELKTGLTIAVKFTNSNTASSPTLKVNSLEAKGLRRYGNTVPGTQTDTSWLAGAVVTLTYDGSYWQMHDWNNTTYSNGTAALLTAGTDTTNRLWTPKILHDAVVQTLTSGTEIGSVNGVKLYAPSGGASMPAGVITQFAGSTAPTGWLLCNGNAVSRTTYSALFTAIGTTYGTGNGSTTFNLPNFQGRVPVGSNTTYALGSSGGEATHTLTVDEMPTHNHGTGLTGYGQITGTGMKWEYVNDRGVYDSGYDIILDKGGGQAHNNMQPYLTVNYIICTGA